MINGTGSVSLRKKDLTNQKTPTVGFTKTVFAHKASAGETGITLTSLATPSELTSNGFSQPSVAQLQNANLLFYRNNLTLVSSARGRLIDFLAYTVDSNIRISFKDFVALEGEIFTGTIDYTAASSTQVVDAAPLIATGTLPANTQDFNTGTPFKVGQYATSQMGAVAVYLDGMQQFRNTGNSSVVLDGNYYEVDVGDGLGVIIRFNATDASDRSVAVVSNGLLAERPNGSMMAVIENTQGQLNNMAEYVAALAGVTETDVLGAAPSNVDLKVFGDKVLNIDERTQPAQLNARGVAYKKPSERVQHSGSNDNTTSTSLVDVPAMSLVITLEEPAKIGFSFSGSWRNNTAGVLNYMNIDINGIKQFGTDGILNTTDTSNYFYPICFTGMTTELPAGTYTVKAQWRVTAGTATILGDTSTPRTIMAWQV